MDVIIETLLKIVLIVLGIIALRLIQDQFGIKLTIVILLIVLGIISWYFDYGQYVISLSIVIIQYFRSLSVTIILYILLVISLIVSVYLFHKETVKPNMRESISEIQRETRVSEILKNQLERLNKLEENIKLLIKTNDKEQDNLSKFQNKYSELKINKSPQNGYEVLFLVLNSTEAIKDTVTIEEMKKILKYTDYEKASHELEIKKRNLNDTLGKVKQEKEHIDIILSYFEKVSRDNKNLVANTVPKIEYDQLKNEKDNISNEITEIKDRAKKLPPYYQEFLKGEKKEIILAGKIEDEKREWQKRGLLNVQFIKNLFQGTEFINDDEYINKIIYLSKTLRANERFIAILAQNK